MVLFTVMIAIFINAFLSGTLNDSTCTTLQDSS